MATPLGSLQATRERRSVEAHLNMTAGTDFLVTLVRETVLRDESGNILGTARDATSIWRLASQVAGMTITVEGKKISGVFLMEALAALFDKFDVDETAAREAAALAEAARVNPPENIMPIRPMEQ